MQVWLAGSYERLGRRYGAFVLAVSLGLTCVLGAPGSLLIAARFWGLSVGEYLRAVAVLEVATLLVVPVLALVLRRQGTLFARWAAGERSDDLAFAVADAAQRFPRRVVLVGTALSAPLLAPVGMIVVLEPAGRWALGDVAAFAAGTTLSTVAITLTVWVWLQLAIRPLLADIAAAVPAANRVQARPGRIALRLGVGLVVSTVTAALIAIALTSEERDGAGDFVRAWLLAGAIGIAGVLPLVGGLALLVLDPIRHLTRGARAVGVGDLDMHVPVTATDELGTMSESFNAMVAGLRERDTLHTAMDAYIDPAIAERMLAEGGSKIAGEAADATVMFVDIVGFTSSAEEAEPADVVAELNAFFGMAIPVVERHRGHANKLLGDGFMAVFGVPSAVEDHAGCALAAAREIAAGVGDLDIGIGLNSGIVIAGSMGGGGKLDYTIIGDVVNVAARVEAYTRESGDVILLTEATRRRLSPDAELDWRGERTLRGRLAPIQLWAAA